MNLRILESTFSIVKLQQTEPIPPWAIQGDVFSITKTDEELSIVCPSENIPENAGTLEIEHDWKAMKVEGILDFGLTGILASLANPLAENQISIFAISTYNTDYILVKSHSIEKAKFVLEKTGNSFS